MPTYEYRCEACGYQFEEFQSISDNPIKVCPKCKKESVKKLISGGSGLIFKGSGFYITDYKKKNNTGSTNSKKDLPNDSKNKKVNKTNK